VDSIQVENNEEIINDAYSVFALPILIKPGKHQYLVKYKDSTEKN
jgi:hypothetical protein